MRKTLICAVSATALTLAACSKPDDTSGPASEAAADVAEAPASQAASSEPAPPAAAAERADSAGTTLPALDKLPASLPQLAYEYDYRWRMEADAIGSLQRRHASLCEQQGPAVCQIIGMTKTGAEEGAVEGQLQMAVATRQARAFGALLEDEALDSGAQQVSAEIASEELSKQIVDTEARVAARTELRDRLREVLRTRKGKVEELIEAERSVAAVNEEIDAAKSWLKEMEGRVAYSRVTVHYETGSAPARDFLAPVSGALGSLGAIFGYLVAFLILAGSVALPAGAAWWAVRRFSQPRAPMPPASETTSA
ncbi:DUF4349 domain-containing protein [Erythrobacter sp. BLCC-B19]|uniref:DUF4349 domain-containing protein n=1 Tax=Erythrobacter sp. BLCC-B19 TaxID=3025315 RepID=UPI0023627AF5|nr:DUF4349 domain-containing protein [Erythrobacter sp. BLCC-B19]WDA40041.1 DUF4349 domain-containing protein [Erythrobacter sp. BLCC-B19]